MKKIIKEYGQFLKMTSEQYAEASKKHRVGCLRGCYECCTVGFFDITLLDAVHLRSALKKVPAAVRKRIVDKATEQLATLEKKGYFSWDDPILKNGKDIDAISRRSAKMSCPALGDNGACLIYEHRPHICRIFGPTIRGKRRTVHLEGCGYFKRDIPEADFPVLSNYKDEAVLLNALYRTAGRKRRRDIDTTIPAALILDLKKWL